MTERRYTEDEVAAIFARAAEAEVAGSAAGAGHAPGAAPVPRAEGRTLTELQAIGEEVGLPADLVARAAHSLDAGGTPERRALFGFPIAVGRTVELERRLTEEEWERLVVDLRETFDARGRLESDGAFRQWTNGNLQALLEPVGDGHRLRLRTLNGGARGYMTGGVALLGFALILALAFVLTGVAGEIDAIVILSLLGAGLFGAGAARLPGWASTRQAQMDGIAERLVARTIAGAGKGAAAEEPDSGRQES